jgi:hypothetical protein
LGERATGEERVLETLVMRASEPNKKITTAPQLECMHMHMQSSYIMPLSALSKHGDTKWREEQGQHREK